jgi:hypothetical protein
VETTFFWSKQNAMKNALQVEEEYLHDIHDAMGNCTFDCVQMSLLHLYTEAARRVLDFIDDDREEIIRFLGNGILLPVVVCIRSNNNLFTLCFWR